VAGNLGFNLARVVILVSAAAAAAAAMAIQAVRNTCVVQLPYAWCAFCFLLGKCASAQPAVPALLLHKS
jgi:hypothetical protein